MVQYCSVVHRKRTDHSYWCITSSFFATVYDVGVDKHRAPFLFILYALKRIDFCALTVGFGHLISIAVFVVVVTL